MFSLLFLLAAFAAALFLTAVFSARRASARREWSFELSRVIANCLGVIGRNPAVFFGASFLLAAMPGIAGALLLGVERSTTAGRGLAQASTTMPIGFALASFLLSQFLQLLLIRLALDDLQEQRVGAVAAARAVLPLLLPAVVLTILAAIGVSLGFLLFFVPGVMLVCAWLVVHPVLVAERPGLIDCFSRSGELTKGARWSVFLLLVMAGVIWSVLFGLVALLALAGGKWVAIAVGALSDTLFSSVLPAGLAAIYHELRSQKEGLAPGELEAVFA